MLNIALIGYGQMGKIIDKLAPEYDCRVVRIIDPSYEEYNHEINRETLFNADVCIDFSLPDHVIGNVESICKTGKKVVLGTTGWFASLSSVESIVRMNNTGLIYASNFSIGMNIFFYFAEQIAGMVADSGIYDAYGYEKHHNKKVDSPSGTAKDLAEILVRSFPKKKKTVYDKLDRKIEESELHFASIRAGSIPGTHTFGFDSPFDNIECTHTARNRDGFAIGALKAAHWITNKEGTYNYSDVFVEVIKS